jgi:hypothetical protein
MSPTKPFKIRYPLNFSEARQAFTSLDEEINGAIQTREDAEYAEVPPWVIPTHRPTTTSTVTSDPDLQNTLNIGRPVLYVQSDIPYYGRLKTVTTDTWTIQGAPMTVGTDFAEHGFFLGYSESMVQMDLRLPGLYGAGATTTALLTLAGTFRLWGGSRARLVAFAARHATNDTTVNPKINILVDGARVSTNNGNLGIQPLAASWVWNPDVAIHTTNYIIETDDPIEIEVTAAGGTGDASDLSVVLFICYEKRAMSDILQLVNRYQ